jgi:hypothetical protein
MDWDSFSQYAATTATSGVLTVNDGNGHVETFNLVNYVGAGVFTAQNDGQGGTLVFTPDANSPTVQPAINSNNPELSSLAIDNNAPAVTQPSMMPPSYNAGPITGSAGQDQFVFAPTSSGPSVHYSITDFEAGIDKLDAVNSATIQEAQFPAAVQQGQ